MSQTPLFDKAIMLARRGIPVFPCNADKQPTTANGLHDATTDPATLWALWQRYPGCLIGARTGAPSGYDVIDIDPRHNGDLWENEHDDDLRDTFAYLTKSGGTHYWFRHTDGVRNSSGVLAEGVDVRGDGGYVIVWPTSGCRMLCENEAREMPAHIADQLLAAAIEKKRPGVAKDCEGEGSSYGMTALDRECDAILDAADGSKHAVLNRAAFAIGGLVTAGELPEDYARQRLSEAVDGIANRCRDANAAYKTLDRSFDEGMAQPRHVEKSVMAPLADIADIPLVARLMAQRDAAAQTRAETASPPSYAFPDALLHVDGFLAEFIEHTLATSRRPQPVAALAAGLALISALAGRRYRTRTGLWSNVYVASIIDSGGGKEHARKIIKEIVSKAMLMRYLGGEEIASGAALQTSMSGHPSRLFLIDEAGDFLNSVLGKNAPAHKQQIAQRLKTFYTSSGSVVLGTEYADQGKQGRPRVDIHNPCAAIYGTTTPRQFWDAVAGASMEDGLMGRFMLFIPTDDYGEIREPDLATAPDSLIEGAKAIAAGVEGGKNLASAMLADVPADPFTIPYASGAMAFLQSIEREQERLLRENAGTYVTSLAARLVENAIKLALLRAVSANPSSPVITADYMKWGATIARHCFETMLEGARRYASENDNQARVMKVREIVRRSGGECSKQQLTRSLNGRMKAAEINDALDLLEAAGEVEVARLATPGSKRPTIIIRLIG